MSLLNLRTISIPLCILIDSMPSYVKDCCQVVYFNPNSIIVGKGEPADKLFVFCDGEIAVEKYFENGKNYVLSKHSSSNKIYKDMPDLLGVPAVMANQKYYGTTVTATKKCTTIKITKEIFIKWVSTDIDFCFVIAKNIANQFYLSSSNSGVTSAYSVKYQLTKYLIEKYNDSKEVGFYILNENRKNIADLLFTTERTVNRAVYFLKNSDCVTIFKGKICITQVNYINLKELSLELNKF